LAGECEAVVIHIGIGCTFEFVAERDTHAIVMVEPHLSEVGRVVRSSFGLTPETASSVYIDSFGNWCRRLDLLAGPVTLTFDAEISVSDQPDGLSALSTELSPSQLPAEALMFVLPSRYCESDQVADVAFGQFGLLPPGWTRVQAICDWVHGEMQFNYAAASPSLSAADVLASRTGVCRDFTHLAIAMCRALNIPARYVFGYLPEIAIAPTGADPDFCAWMEVFLDGTWHTFDPRNNQRRIGRVVIGRGRDAADVAMITSFGSVELTSMTVRAGPVA
jgi:transglutaminase-like putative cysteine protease